MPVQVSYPGVYVQEIPSGVRTITGVSTSIALFVGMNSRGRMREPVRVLSFADYERAFGTDTVVSEMTDQVRQFFLNGGQQAFVMRIAHGDEAARVELKDQFTQADTVLTLEARSAGAIGETLRIEVDYNTPTPESTFNLRVLRVEADANGVLQVVEREPHSDLTMNPSAGNYAVRRLNQQSNLVKPEAGTPPAAIQGFSVAGVLMAGVTQLKDIIDKADPTPTTPGNPKGKFQISVDRTAFVTVEIDAPADATPAAIDGAITDPINTALASTVGKTISATLITLGSLNALQIRSTTVGGSVRIARASTKDIAGPMQIGVAQGGLEVDGFAPQRPAPTSLFSVLGVSGGDLAALGDLIDTDPATVTELTMTDASPSSPQKVDPLAWRAPGGTNLSHGSLTGDQETSLLNLKENLEFLVAQINSSNIPWSAELHGFRIVLVPEFGGPDADITASIATAPTDLGGAGQIFSNTTNVKHYQLGNFANNKGIYQVGARRGEDGTFPESDDYQKAFSIIDRKVDIFNLMILPRALDQKDDDRQPVWGLASVFCQQRRAFLLIDPLSDNKEWSDVNQVTDRSGGIEDFRRNTGAVKDHAAIYWPRLLVSTNGTTKPIDPSGAIAGLMARTDSNRGVWKAPAGLEATFRGVRGVEYSMSDLDNGLINPQAVNAIRVFPNGIVSWGARTMDGFDNSGNDDYKYIPVRRLALFIEESLYRGLKFAVFEPNDEPLWAQIRLAAGAFMNNLFRQGAFQGQKASDAYLVKVDSETTTQNDINLGIVNVVIGFAPLKPAEFVIITIQQLAGQVQV